MSTPSRGAAPNNALAGAAFEAKVKLLVDFGLPEEVTRIQQ